MAQGKQAVRTDKVRTPCTQKYQCAGLGNILRDIMAKRIRKPEVRKAQRGQAVCSTLSRLLILLISGPSST